ncbi:MAG: hypothetical protein ACI957_001955 [Verrucomicrobiales bacterium]|jgi:hypothetical protein
MRKTHWFAIAVSTLFVVTLFLRFVGFKEESLVNIAPITAMALCFGLFSNRSAWGFALAFVGLFLSDVFVTALVVHGDPTLSFAGLLFSPVVGLRYLVYGAFFGIAWLLHKRRSSALALVITPLATGTFYIVMNTVAWISSMPPFAYAKTFAGWWQSQTIGLPIPGAPPSYLFLRNAMVGDALFTILFLALVVWVPKKVSGYSPDSPLNAAKNAV